MATQRENAMENKKSHYRLLQLYASYTIIREREKFCLVEGGCMNYAVHDADMGSALKQLLST